VAPVLVVGPQPSGSYASPLVAIADNEGSTFVIDAALRVVPPGFRRLDLATAAFVPMEGWLWGGWISTKEILRIKAMKRRRTREAVEHGLAPYRDRGLRLRLHLREGEPRKVILDQAKRQRADVLVVGTHARVGIVRFRLGSVAAHVIRHAPCDVLVVRPAGLVMEEARWQAHAAAPTPTEKAIAADVELAFSGGQDSTSVRASVACC
jgi:nucleotide-binding universal stress UspA family protein